VSLVDQALDEGRPDEPRSPGDEDLHDSRRVSAPRQDGAGLDLGVVADHGQAVDLGGSPHDRAGPDDRFAHRRALADARARQDQRSVDDGSGFDDGGVTHPRSRHLGGVVHLGGGGHRRVGAGGAVEVVETGLQVGGGGAGIDPAAGPFEGVEGAVGDHGREHLPLDRHLAARFDAAEHRRLEHVGAAVDPVGGGILTGVASR
jgi:hypothetical protein